MKKRITCGLVLILSSLLTFQPIVALAMSEASTAASNPRSPKLIPPPKPARPARPVRSQTGELAGQTSTLLPDGRLLLAGGQDSSGPKTMIAISDPRTGEVVPLSVVLRYARAWHTASMLPNGRVLIVGGKGLDDTTVASAEILDLASQTVELISSPSFARAYHSATLLTDGRVLIVGGLSATGQALNKAELWDFKTKTATTLNGKLAAGRQKQKATLQADGNILIEGGADRAGNEIPASEIFNVESLNFEPAANASSSATPGAAYLAGSVPANDAVDVPTDSLIGLRFSRPLAVQTINSATITINGPHGAVATRTVPTEGGRLAFVTPLPALEAGTTYTVNFAGATDSSGVVTPALFSFTTQGNDTSNRSGDEDWVPGADNLRGNWRSKPVNSEAQSLPPLQAEAGVTALAGQVLTLNGRPLAGVSLQIGSASTQTDQTGRFLLTNLSSGHHVMRLDGKPASIAGKTYGVFKIGVDITADKTNLLGYTIWMPKLDTAHSVNIQSPTTKQTVVTNPLIPGLELQLPPQTVIRDMDGNTVNQLSITPIPTNQPPFPLPAGVSVPVFFTIQPGGSQVIPPRAQLIYPNYTNQPAGARIDFWNYDAEDKGWYVYGRGTVTPNGRQIVPDPGVVLYEFTGAMVSNPSNAPPEGPEPCEACRGGDPVDLGTGLFVYSKTDLIIPDTLPLVLTRTYRPRDTVSRPFGIGATHPFELFLVGDIFPYTFADLILPDGGRVHYNRISPGTGFSDAVYEHTETPSAFYKSTIRFGGFGWILTLQDGTVFEFPDAEAAPTPRQAAMVAMRDRYGNAYAFTRDANHNLTKISSPNGKYIEFTYDASNRITLARDNIGRTVTYTYDASGRLWKATDAAGVTEYLYDTSNRMTKITDPKGILYLTNTYDTNGRVIKQTQADSTFYQFAYTLGANGQVTQTDVTDPRGNVRRVTFNSSGAMITDTYAVGKPEQQTFTYSRQAGTNQILSETDPLGRQTTYTYDSNLNVTSITRLAGTSGAVTTSYTYEPTFSLLASITDPLNHTVTFGHDALGNITSVTDPLNHQLTMTYNAAGQVTSITDPLQHTVQLGYESGTLTTYTDALGRTTTRFVDDAGRVLSTRNPLGETARYEYDALNQLKKFTDPLGGATSYTYDANGNLLTVKDAKNNVTTYTYNNMDRLTSRKDALLRTQSYVYDGMGNLTKLTDRRGKVTNYTYDNRNRVNFAGFGAVVSGQNTTYESTINYTYDAGDRLTQTVDSVSGTMTFGYDNLDRLTSQTTPQGSVSYGYDAASRRTSMTVAGQPAVSYAYDNADRVTSITQGTNVVGVAHDDADRLTSFTLPNGLRMEYGYDVASQLTGITYKNGALVLGDLTYTYDAAGRRKNTGGSFARVAFPQAVASSTFNANNQLTQRGSATLAYDLNGNLTSDGVNTYTWDARNQLASVSGGVSASFSYDSFGRRKAKTVNGATTEFLYDGSNVVQEKTGGSPSANMLMGGTDRTFTRTDASGSSHFFTDALGTTLGLTNSSGALSTQYTYEPFGQATASGAASSNSSQFTGRENDGTGLQFYRSRYYSPTLQRFISEDSIGFSGGDTNLYGYVFNSPTNFTDSSGQIIDTLADVGFIIYDIYQLATGSRKDRTMNIIALGADVAGAVIPFATGLGAATRAARTAERTIVIGEDMARVEKYAERIGAETYQGAAGEANRQWIREAREAGAEVVDIGPNFDRRAERAARGENPLSDAYNMERQETKGYDNYRKVFKRNGKKCGGVPGLDF